MDTIAENRPNERPVPDALPDPGSYVIPPGDITADFEAKPPRALKDLYPDIAKFRTYPTERYQTREAMIEERERLWSKVWLVSGRASDIPLVGDWYKFDLGPESFIIVRSAPGRVQAFHNVCRHRGNQLVQTDFGHGFRAFTCVVHSWSWDLKGRNIRVTDRETFQPEALCGELNLSEVHAHEWGGFVFISMNPNPMPFEEYYAGLLPTLASYRMEEMYVVKDLTIEIAANWKTIYTVFNEAYHAHSTHPQIKLFAEDYFIQTDFYPNGHNRHMFPLAQISPRWTDHETINDPLAYLMAEAGVDPASFTGGPGKVRRAIQQAKRRPDNAYGMDYAGFTDNQLTDDWNPSLFPNVTMNMHPEGVLFMRMRPHATDPERGYYDVMVLSRKLADGRQPPAYMGVEPGTDVSGDVRPERIRTTSDDPRAGELLEQDVANLVTLQTGMRSRGIKGMLRFSEQEQRIQQFHAEMELYLNGSKTGI